MHTTGWSRGLEVSGGGQGVVSHAGLALLRHLADKTGLTGGLSRAPPASGSSLKDLRWADGRGSRDFAGCGGMRPGCYLPDA